LLANGPIGASIVSVTPPFGSSVFTVVVNTGSGDGTLALKLVDDNSINAVHRRLGGAAIGDGNFTGESYAIQKSAPQGANKVVGTRVGTDYTFQVSDFGFSDPN